MKVWQSAQCDCSVDRHAKNWLTINPCHEHAGLPNNKWAGLLGMGTMDWTLPTCGCKVEELEDRTVQPYEMLGYTCVWKKCNHHADISDEEIYEVCYGDPRGTAMGEQMLVSYTRGYLIGKGGVDFGLHESKKNKDGSSAGEDFKDGFDYKWHFTGTGRNRKLNWEVKGSNLTQKQKQDIKEACDGRFGKDRVIPI